MNWPGYRAARTAQRHLLLLLAPLAAPPAGPSLSDGPPEAGGFLVFLFQDLGDPLERLVGDLVVDVCLDVF